MTKTKLFYILLVVVAIVGLVNIGLWIALHPSWVWEQPDTANYVHKTVGLITDLPHATAELFYSAVENGVVLLIGYQLAKRHDRKEHARLDREHGHEHEEDSPL